MESFLLFSGFRICIPGFGCEIAFASEFSVLITGVSSVLVIEYLLLLIPEKKRLIIFFSRIHSVKRCKITVVAYADQFREFLYVRQIAFLPGGVGNADMLSGGSDYKFLPEVVMSAHGSVSSYQIGIESSADFDAGFPAIIFLN